MGKRKEYESMTNNELLEVAMRKGLSVSAQERNGLTIFRAVLADPQGLADRRAFIARLNAFDKRRQSNFTLLISLIASVAAIISLITTFVG